MNNIKALIHMIISFNAKDMSKKYIIHSWTIHTNLSLFNNISLLPPEFFGRFINRFLFSLLSMVTLKQTFKKHGRNLPGFQNGKKETKMNDTYQSGLVHNPNHFLNMFSGPPLSLPDGLKPLCEILFFPLLSSRAPLSWVTKCTFT